DDPSVTKNIARNLGRSCPFPLPNSRSPRMAKEHPDDSQKTPEEARERIWELAEKIDICMFTTWDGKRQRSRPLSARVKRDEHAVYFLVDVEGSKNAEIEQFPWVSCAWADNSNWKYVV